jgi:hypothetical protein
MGGRRRTRRMRGGNFYGGVVDAGLGTAGLGYAAITNNGASSTGQIPASDIAPKVGGRRKKGGLTAKTMKKLLKKAGMKTTGKKAALTRRLKKIGAMRGGSAGEIPSQAASAGYTGQGIGGMIDVVDTSIPRAGGVLSA